MTDRIEVNEKDLDNVVGGAFVYNTYTNADGSEYMNCTINGGATYNCSTNAKRQLSLFIMNTPSATADDVVNYALQNGLFW